MAIVRPAGSQGLACSCCVCAILPWGSLVQVSLDVGPAGIQELTGWPEFHNGVAAGLKYQPPWFASSGPEVSQVRVPHASPGTRAWIMYNKPAEASSSHAGVVLALGLQGHLAALATTDLYRYLAQVGPWLSSRGSRPRASSCYLAHQILTTPSAHPKAPYLEVLLAFLVPCVLFRVYTPRRMELFHIS